MADRTVLSRIPETKRNSFQRSREGQTVCLDSGAAAQLASLCGRSANSSGSRYGLQALLHQVRFYTASSNVSSGIRVSPPGWIRWITDRAHLRDQRGTCSGLQKWNKGLVRSYGNCRARSMDRLSERFHTLLANLSFGWKPRKTLEGKAL